MRAVPLTKLLMICAAVPFTVYLFRVFTFTQNSAVGHAPAVQWSIEDGAEPVRLCGVPEPTDPLTSATCDDILSSTRYDKECTPDTPENLVFPVLVTGFGSYHAATADALRQLKVRMSSALSHPSMEWGMESWILAYNDFLHAPRKEGGLEGNRFSRIVAQVRDPLRAIAHQGMNSINLYADFHVQDQMPSGNNADAHLGRSLMVWVTWYEHLLKVGDEVFREEDGDLYGLCRRAFGPRCEATREEFAEEFAKAMAQKTKRENEAGATAHTTWEELERLNPEYTDRAKALAKRMGYCVDTQDKDPLRFQKGYEEAKEAKKQAKLKAHPEHEMNHILSTQPKAKPVKGVKVDKMTNKVNPVISQYSFMKNELEDTPSHNVGWPSVLEVPSWVSGKKGKFLLYNSGSMGQYIRAHYADDIKGPYHNIKLGVLARKDLPWCGSHIANPYVMADDDAKKLYMYFHCGVCVDTPDHTCKNQGEVVFRAESKDGLKWTASPTEVGKINYRVTRIGGWYYLFGKDSILASKDGVTGMKNVGRYKAFTPLLHKNTLYFFWPTDNDSTQMWYSVNELPEGTSTNMTAPVLGGDVWSNLRQGQVLFNATETWETPIHGGKALAAPFPIVTKDGRLWLMYTAAEKAGIALAEVKGLLK